MQESSRESWRTTISFVAAGMIFVLCQVLSGSGSGPASKTADDDPGDRTYTAREEMSEQSGPTLASAKSVAVPSRANPTSRPVGDNRPTD